MKRGQSACQCSEARTRTPPTPYRRPLGCYGRRFDRTSRKTIREALDSSEGQDVSFGSVLKLYVLAASLRRIDGTRNFARIHGSLRITPAMEAGIADHVWSLKELIELLQDKTKSAAA